MRNFRLRNKLYSLRPMAKLTLLQEFGISVEEIYRSKNLISSCQLWIQQLLTREKMWTQKLKILLKYLSI